MRACGVDIARLKKDVGDYIDAELSNLAVTRPDDAKPTAAFSASCNAPQFMFNLPAAKR